MLECDTEIGPSVFMNLLEHNQWGKRYIKDEAEFDLCTEGEGSVLQRLDRRRWRFRLCQGIL